MKLFPLPLPRCSLSRAYTLTEALFALAISSMAMTALVMVVLTIGRVEQTHLADASLQYQTGMLQDRLTGIIRPMNATEAISPVDAVAGRPGLYRRILFAPAAAVPRYALWFDSTNRIVYFSTNWTSSAATSQLFKSDYAVTLRDMYFSLPLKNDGSSENSMVNIVMQFDDNGYAVRRSSGGLTNTTVIRTFSIKLRNG